MVEIAESYLWLLLNRGRCFQSLTTPSEAGYTLLCASCDWWEMCVLFFNSLSCLSYLLIKGAWQDRMQLPGLFRERCSLLMCNSTFPCQVHPCPCSVACLKDCVYSGSDRWQGDKCYIEGVSTVQTCSTASKASELCGSVVLCLTLWVLCSCYQVFSRTFVISMGSHERSFVFQRRYIKLQLLMVSRRYYFTYMNSTLSPIMIPGTNLFHERSRQLNVAINR